MKVVARFHGILADWMGTPAASIDLPSHADYGDLLVEIRRRYSPNMPAQLWDPKKNAFTKSVQAFRCGKRLEAFDARLGQEQEIIFYLMIAGG